MFVQLESRNRMAVYLRAFKLNGQNQTAHYRFPHRWTQAAEHVATIREPRSKPAASFHGKYVNFEDVVCNPKRVQVTGAPILIGSTDKNALRWVARWT
jgi:alkanesulfonate monooxygenase SsuD/methylene tetrahydromethanopterin reductase-like flavin-dependent oxidoreductase (luciferase family)